MKIRYRYKFTHLIAILIAYLFALSVGLIIFYVYSNPLILIISQIFVPFILYYLILYFEFYKINDDGIEFYSIKGKRKIKFQDIKNIVHKTYYYNSGKGGGMQEIYIIVTNEKRIIPNNKIRKHSKRYYEIVNNKDFIQDYNLHREKYIYNQK